MTAAVLIDELRARGVTLVANGNWLHCRPRSALTEEDLAALRAHKAEVLGRLHSDQEVDLVCFACKERRFWRSIYGVVVCGTCHPPASPGRVAEWIGDQREVPS